MTETTVRRPRLRSSSAWNLVGALAPMLLGVAVFPYLIATVHLEAFGVLTLIWALIGYFSVFDFGVGRALTHEVSRRHCAASTGELQLIVRTGLRIVGGMGAVGGLLLAAGASELGTRWLNISPALQQTATHCLLICALGIPLTTLTTGYRGVLEGLEEFKAANVLRVLLGCANFGLPALSVLLFGPSLEYIVWSLVIARAVVLFAHAWVVRRHFPRTAQAEKTEPGTVRRLFSFGAWMTVSNTVGPLMVTADRFIISNLLGGASVAFYTVPFDFIVRLLVIPAALTGALFPRFVSLFATDPAAFRHTYRKSLKTILLIMLPVSAAIALGARPGLALWLGDDFAAAAWPVASLLAVGLLFNGLAQVPHAALQASGGVKATALLHTAELVFYVPLLYGGLLLFGIVGAAAAWTLRVFADMVVLLVLFHKRVP
jgi:O-antigen/teichoic acid export membrane protein